MKKNISKTSITFFYVTAPSLSHSKRIAQILIKEKLIACANIFPAITSVYLWKNKIESGKECVLILKTTSAKATRLEKRLQELHPYDCPCIAQISPKKINTAFGDYIAASTSKVTGQ